MCRNVNFLWRHVLSCAVQVVDISKLFNPQSYLTAIKQITCQNVGLELDKLQVPSACRNRHEDLRKVARAEQQGSKT